VQYSKHHNVSETGSASVLRWRGWKTLCRVRHKELTSPPYLISNGLYTGRVSAPPPPQPEDGNTQFQKRCVLYCCSEYRMTGNVHKPQQLQVLYTTIRSLQNLLGHNSVNLIEHMWSTIVCTQTKEAYRAWEVGVILVHSFKRIPIGWTFRRIGWHTQSIPAGLTCGCCILDHTNKGDRLKGYRLELKN
jgi:hypothetical protein